MRANTEEAESRRKEVLAALGRDIDGIGIDSEDAQELIRLNEHILEVKRIRNKIKELQSKKI